MRLFVNIRHARTQRDVAYVATHSDCSMSFDHLVGALLENPRHVETERLGGFEVDHQLELDRSLDRKLARLRALEDAIGVNGSAPKIVDLLKRAVQ